MDISSRVLLEENQRLKTQLLAYEQYQVVLSMQKNLAVSLGGALNLDEALDLVLATVSHIEGVSGCGILMENNDAAGWNLSASFGFSHRLVEKLDSFDSTSRDISRYFDEQYIQCRDDPFLSRFFEDYSESVRLGIFNISGAESPRVILLVICEERFFRVPLAADLLDAVSNQIGGVFTRVRQRALLTKSLKEKEILLREVHHRVKNNLAMISSFIALQESIVRDIEARNILEGLQKKIESIVIIYKLLYRNESIQSVALNEYSVELLRHIINTLSKEPESIGFDCISDKLSVSIDMAIVTGMILAELATNSIKYAFKDEYGTIGLRIGQKDGKILLSYWDTGKAFPEGFVLSRSRGLGEHLVRELTRQLGGTVEFSAEESRFDFIFPAEE